MDLFGFGDKLKNHLKEKGLSQKWLASQLGDHVSTVNKWVLGINRISFDKLKQICELLNILGPFVKTTNREK